MLGATDTGLGWVGLGCVMQCVLVRLKFRLEGNEFGFTVVASQGGETV